MDPRARRLVSLVVAAVAITFAAAAPGSAFAGGVWTGSFSVDEVSHVESGDGSVVDGHSTFHAALHGGSPLAYLGESYTVASVSDDIGYDATTRTISGSCVTTGTEHEAATSSDAGNQVQVLKAPDGAYSLALNAESSSAPRTRHDEKDCDGSPPDHSDANLGTGLSGSLRTPDLLPDGTSVGPTIDGSSRHLLGTFAYDACKVGASQCGPSDSDVRTFSWALDMSCTDEPGDQNANCVRDSRECPTPAAQVVGLSGNHRARLDDRPVRNADTFTIGGSVVVPPHGWLHLDIDGIGLLDLGPSRALLACGKPPTLTSGRAGFTSDNGVLDTPHTSFTAARSATAVKVLVGPSLTRIWVRTGRGRVRTPGFDLPLASMSLLPGDKLLAHRGRLPQLDTWPFAPSPAQRPARGADRLPAFWADGQSCSVACRPGGAVDGWPVKPFHRQHPLRAGLNERRRANMHLGVDIQARDGARVYAMQPGRATVMGAGTVDERVQVGDYIYWHIRHKVTDGQFVVPYKTVVGTIIRTAGHFHLSEVHGGRYLNPLRPGGRVLSPWGDTMSPVVGRPSVTHDAAGYHVIVKAFDPQSFRELIKYRTPVLALAALAYRAFDARGGDVTGLRWALRGSQHYPDGDRFVIYAHGAHTRGWSCFAARLACPPDWKYNLTDGLTPPIPSRATTLDIYAYDWAGNVSVREVDLTHHARSARARAGELPSRERARRAVSDDTRDE